MSLDGHIDGTNAQGELIILETVEHEGVIYTVTRIGRLAFSHCDSLTGSLMIPSTVDTIQVRAFEHCSGFTGNLVVPNTVKYLGVRAFEWCSGFDGQLSLSESITVINSGTFHGCQNLTGTLTIPNSVTRIKCEAFCDCTGFTGDLVIPNSVVELNEGPTPQPNTVLGAFENCTGFNGHLTLPESLQVIHSTNGGGCFAGCSNLTGQLVLPNSLKEIGSSAFSCCLGFTGPLILPDALTYIGPDAFNYCPGFEGALVIPNQVVKIDVGAFEHCTGITNVTIGASVERMEHDVFLGTPIDTIRIHAETPPSLHFNAFNGISRDIPVYIPCHTIELYQNAEHWNEFTNFIEDCSLAADEQGEDEVQVLFYPNPVQNTLHLEYSPDVAPKQIELYDLQGRLVLSQTNGLECLNMERLPAGTYTMRVMLENGKVFSDKVMKE